MLTAQPTSPLTSLLQSTHMPQSLSFPATLIASLLALLPAINARGDSPKDQAFVALFDGSSLEGWEHQNNWAIEDGVLARTGKGGNIVYKAQKVPDNFELQFEWKVGEGSNSGVYYRPTQYEYQILDNQLHKDGKNPRTSAASLYFCMQPSEDATRPVGQWNEGRVICQGTKIQHWLNGKKVVDIDYADPKFKFHVDLLKQRGGNLEARGAYLSLQDHGDPVWYRNIRIREVSDDEPLDASPIEPAVIPAEARAAEKKKLEGILKRREQAQAKSSKAT